ncbi:hypothetical protein ACTPGW_002615 [Enterococcus faecalis]
MKNDKKNWNKTAGKIASLLIAYIAFVLFVALVTASAMSFNGEISKNPFLFHTLSDGLLVFFLALSVVTTNYLLIKSMNKKNTKDKAPIKQILYVFNDVLALSSIIPLFALNNKVNASGVENVVKNTYTFYYATLLFMVIGVCITVFLIRDYLKKSNWWFFIISIPYVIVGWFIQEDFSSFKLLVESSEFSYGKMASALDKVDLDLVMLNPTFFDFLAGIIVVLILVIGLIIYEKVWSKTKRWR